MKERQGSVWYESRKVGDLRTDSRGIIHFRYDPGWLKSGFPISLQLPQRNGEDETNAHSFFQGLLPEGRSRQRICQRLRVNPDDDAGLLLVIGEDCAGALSILPADTEPNDTLIESQEISREKVHEIVLSKGERAPEILDDRRRFSLAGAQEKLPVLIQGDRYFRPNLSYPSTHILKFETYSHVCFSEYMTLRLGAKLEMDVVDCDYKELEHKKDKTPYLTIRRYDREIMDDGRVRRLHQEDATQALGYTADFKYQRDGGPGLDVVAMLAREETSNPSAQVQRLIRWQVFNYLVGNFDAHGKNLSLLYRSAASLPELAPFYDLVSIEFINRIGNTNYERELAFSIGGQYIPERINKMAWEQFAKELGVRSTLVFRNLKEMAVDLPNYCDEELEDFANRFGDRQVYERFRHTISERCRWALRMLA